MKHTLNELKRTIFNEMLDIAGRVFIVARHSDAVVIGNRGFTQEEMENGIVLVFNRSMNFTWDESGISSTLVFGTSPQKCFIPSDDILAIYSPELKSQFITAAETVSKTPDAAETAEEAESNVVKVDFKKKRPSRHTVRARPEKRDKNES